MPTLADISHLDCVGLTKYGERQCRAMVQYVKEKGLLNSSMPVECDGEGIVIAGGGKYLSWAWVLCRRLRDLGCRLPVQVWYLGQVEMPDEARVRFEVLGVELVDAYVVMRSRPVRQMSGWILKNYAVTNCPWERVLFLDADCFPVKDPTSLLSIGTLFFHDVNNCRTSDWPYSYCGLELPEREWETGQFVVDKRSGWMGLRWTGWMNEDFDVWTKQAGLYGDKGTFELGFRVSGVPLVMGDAPEWAGYGILHSYQGKPAFQHCMAVKRGEHGMFPWLTALFREWEKEVATVHSRAL